MDGHHQINRTNWVPSCQDLHKSSCRKSKDKLRIRLPMLRYKK